MFGDCRKSRAELVALRGIRNGTSLCHGRSTKLDRVTLGTVAPISSGTTLHSKGCYEAANGGPPAIFHCQWQVIGYRRKLNPVIQLVESKSCANLACPIASHFHQLHVN
jgi:hypothetical protein